LLAGELLAFELNCAFRCLDDGSRPGMVDIELVTSDGCVPVEISQVMDETARRFSAQWSQVHVHLESDFCVIAEYSAPPRGAQDRLQALFDAWGAGLSVAPEQFRSLGISAIHRLDIGPSTEVVFFPERSIGVDADAAVAGIQAEVDKPDNQAKLQQAGSGDLFLWMHGNRPAAFFGASSLVPLSRQLTLPMSINRVWVALAVADGANWERPQVIQLWSFTSASGWANRGHPHRRGFRPTGSEGMD
jgi:hypothetical protein